MAFPVVQAAATTNGTGATANAALNLPTGIKAGELLLGIHRCSAAGAHGWPAGWNELADDASDASTNQTSVAWRQADGTESGTITVTQTSSKFASIIWRIAGACDPSVSPPQLGAIATGTSVSPNPLTVTPTGGAKDYLFFWLGGWENEQTSPPASQPTNYASATPDRQGADSGTAGAVTTNCRVAGTTRANNAASEDPGIWTISVSDDWTCWACAVHPPPAPGLEWEAPIFRPRRGYF